MWCIDLLENHFTQISACVTDSGDVKYIVTNIFLPPNTHMQRDSFNPLQNMSLIGPAHKMDKIAYFSA